MKPAEDRDYLTPAEVARIHHVSPKTVSRWAQQGLLPCLVTLGGHRRFRREHVEEIARRMSGEG
jgi:excisionase family DNA binding protein